MCACVRVLKEDKQRRQKPPLQADAGRLDHRLELDATLPEELGLAVPAVNVVDLEVVRTLGAVVLLFAVVVCSFFQFRLAAYDRRAPDPKAAVQSRGRRRIRAIVVECKHKRLGKADRT